MKKILIVLLLASVVNNYLHCSPFTVHLLRSPSMIMDSTAQLIISEVSDPANTWQARFVELYNPGTDSIDFDQDTWYLSKQSNGGSTWGDILLTGVIHAGKAYVVAYSESSFITTFGFNPDLSSGSINGNGDDGYFLFWGGNHNTGTLVDAYGEIDVDGTGEPWEYLDSKATRKYDAIIPETVWDSLDWTVHVGAETWQMTPSSHRVAVTWNGTINHEWENTANWTFPDSSAFIPDVSDIITIPAGLQHNPTISYAAFCHEITLESDSLANASILGNEYLHMNADAIVQQYISGGTITKDDPNAIYHFASSPLSSTNAISVFPATSYVRYWDEVNQAWFNLSGPDSLETGKGYSVWLADGSAIVSYTGHLNDIDINPALTYTTGNTGNPDFDGYNLVGNPFPSGLDWDAGTWTKNNLDASIAIWDGEAGNYLYWNGIAGGITDGLIPPCQGFFVRANAAFPLLTMPMDARVHSDTLNYKDGRMPDGLIKFAVDGDEYHYWDAAYIGFNEAATINFDAQFDAFKLQGLEYAPRLFSKNSNGQELSLNFLSMEEVVQVPLGFRTGYNGTFTLHVEGMNGFGENIDIQLNDLKLGTHIDLRQISLYTFDYNQGDDPDRFILTVSDLTSLGEAIAESMVKVYSSHQQIIVNTPVNQGEIIMFNLLGQEVLRQIISDHQSIIPAESGEIFLLRVMCPPHISLHKIFVK